MDDRGSSRGAASLAVPLMIVAFLLMAGFLVWLRANAEPTRVVIEEEPDTAGAAALAGTEVTGEQLRMNPAELVGDTVQVTNVGIASSVGEEAFFLDLESPFLVKLGPALVAQGRTVPTGRITVVGPVRAMTDSVRSDWLDSGAAPPSAAAMLDFASHFIEATVIRPAGGAAPPSSGASAGGTGGQGGP